MLFVRVMGPALLLAGFFLHGQEPDFTTISGSARALQADARRTVIAAAELMKTEDYGFAPTGGVRTFGQLVGHVADTQYLFCAAAMGEPNPKPQAPIEKSNGSKADLVAALNDAFAYCDRVFDGTTDANATAVARRCRSTRRASAVSCTCSRSRTPAASPRPIPARRSCTLSKPSLLPARLSTM